VRTPIVVQIISKMQTRTLLCFLAINALLLAINVRSDFLDHSNIIIGSEGGFAETESFVGVYASKKGVKMGPRTVKIIRFG
jgi:16S rRNA U1498 N3-methylase RsmE